MIGEMPSSRTKITIVKVKGGMRVEVVCLAERPLGFFVHWLATRSFMCPGIDCPACFAAVGNRWVGMLPVRYSVPHSEDTHVGVLELTAGTMERLRGLCQMEGIDTLAGLSCVATRRADRSSLLLEPARDGLVSAELKKVFPEWLLLDAMATLYALPSCPKGMTRSEWEVTAIPKAKQLVRVALPRAVA